LYLLAAGNNDLFDNGTRESKVGDLHEAFGVEQ
jgi:hypothetical protein